MPEYRRLYQKGGTYSFTIVTYQRQPILWDDSISLLNECFEETMKNHPFYIEALVILPDHLHTIWTLSDGESDFSSRWNIIKGTLADDIAEGSIKIYLYLS